MKITFSHNHICICMYACIYKEFTTSAWERERETAFTQCGLSWLHILMWEVSWSLVSKGADDSFNFSKYKLGLLNQMLTFIHTFRIWNWFQKANYLDFHWYFLPPLHTDRHFYQNLNLKKIENSPLHHPHPLHPQQPFQLHAYAL